MDCSDAAARCAVADRLFILFPGSALPIVLGIGKTVVLRRAGICGLPWMIVWHAARVGFFVRVEYAIRVCALRVGFNTRAVVS